MALLAENTQIVHSRLVEHLRPGQPAGPGAVLAAPFSLTTPRGIAALNAEATRQAAMVAYIDNFQLMMVIVILSLAAAAAAAPAPPSGGGARRGDGVSGAVRRWFRRRPAARPDR